MSIFEYNEAEHMALVRENGKKEGIQEGIEKGIQEGIEKGIQEGIEKGIQKGRMEGIRDGIVRLISRKMASAGMSFEEACSDLYLSEEEISACREYMKEI